MMTDNLSFLWAHAPTENRKMKRIILGYAAIIALAMLLLKWLDHRFITLDISIQTYLGVVAVLFAAIGIWVGIRVAGSHRAGKEPEPNGEFEVDLEKLEDSGISPRELEVLQLMANGLSNQEIADTLFISLNTVKTHSSSLFVKLDVKRRTQAVQQAKDLGLIP